MNYIERNPNKCFDMPSLIGRRLTVYDIVSQIFGEGMELALEDYEISKIQAKSALEYCGKLMCKIDADKHQFCDGCLLRTVADGKIFNIDSYYEIYHKDGTISTLSKDGLVIFAGSIKELKKEEEGIETWKIAQSIMEQYFPASPGV